MLSLECQMTNHWFLFHIQKFHIHCVFQHRDFLSRHIFTRDLLFFNNLNPQNQIFYRHHIFPHFINFLVEVIYNLILSNICKNIQLFLNILTISQ